MSVALKIIAALLVLGGLYVWVSGHSITAAKRDAAKTTASVPSGSLTASVVTAVSPEEGRFEEEGTIVLDTSHGSPGTPFILYTRYAENGKPSIRTKRLVFTNQDRCGESNLPCATNQPGAPVNPDEKVRVIGTVEDDTVTVEQLIRLSS
ncbi:MAG: hypothetical protein AB199_02580 [Parcubacteria bacterium C7867-004]|nr:MAG: hypothetical protein AB199_02580 [Parcubacteria bacterium C7867-004]